MVRSITFLIVGLYIRVKEGERMVVFLESYVNVSTSETS